MDDEEAWFRVGLPDPGLPLLAEVIATSGLDPEVRELAVDHESISDEELIELMHAGDEITFRRCITSTTRLPVLHYWMLNGNPEQRSSVAFNPAGDSTIALLALSDPDDDVRAHIMFSPALTDEQVQWHVTNDPSSEVRETAQVALESDMGQYLRTGKRSVLIADDDEDYEDYEEDEGDEGGEALAVIRRADLEVEEPEPDNGWRQDRLF